MNKFVYFAKGYYYNRYNSKECFSVIIEVEEKSSNSIMKSVMRTADIPVELRRSVVISDIVVL